MNNPFASTIPMSLYPKQKAWSFSAVTKHEKCPLTIRFTKVDRLVEPANQYMDRGSQMHKAAQALIDHDVDQGLLTPAWTAKVRELRGRGAQSEKQLAFTSAWVPTTWYGADVWGRIIVDACYQIAPGIVQVVEFKSGKKYPDHLTQLRLYALAGFIMFPEAQESRAENWYFDGAPNAMPGYVAQRSMLPKLQEEFTQFAQPLLNDDIYPARPGTHCSRCHFRRTNGGPCSHG